MPKAEVMLMVLCHTLLHGLLKHSLLCSAIVYTLSYNLTVWQVLQHLPD